MADFTLQDAAAILAVQLQTSYEKRAFSTDGISQHATDAVAKLKELLGKAPEAASQLGEYGSNALSSIPNSVLVGGGLGLGAGLLGTAVNKDRRKRWLRNALLGTGLGAGIGGAVHAGQQLYEGATATDPVQEAAAAKAKADAATAASQPPTDAVPSALYNFGHKMLFGEPKTPAGGASDGVAPATGGGAPAGESGPGFLERNYLNSKGTAAASTFGGYQMGKLYDKLRESLPQQVNATTLMNSENTKNLPKDIQPYIADFQKAVYAAQGNGGRVTSDPLTGLPTIHPTADSAPPAKPTSAITQLIKEHTPTNDIKWPGASSRPIEPPAAPVTPPATPRVLKPVAAGSTSPAATPQPRPVDPSPSTPTPPAFAAREAAKRMSNPYQPFTPEQWKNTIVPNAQPAAKPGIRGRVIGTGLGLAGTPLVNSAVNWAFGPTPVVHE